MLMGMCLLKFDIYPGTIAPNCFQNHKKSWCPDFFPKNVSPDVRSEIGLVRRNIVSNEHSVRAKNYIQA